MRLTDEERRAMAAEAIHEADRQCFAAELAMVANRSNAQADQETLKARHAACVQAINDLTAEYAALLSP